MIVVVCRGLHIYVCVCVFFFVFFFKCAYTPLLVEEAAGVEEIVQPALGLGRLEVPRRLDPVAVGYYCWICVWV